MPQKKSLADTARAVNQHRENLMKLTVENLFFVLNDKDRSAGAKKQELLETHALFTREFLALFKENGLIKED
jgi:hypothetical protein